MATAVMGLEVAETSTSFRQQFEVSLRSNHAELVRRGMDPNEAGALALKIAAGLAELPPSPAHALQALRAAREAPLGTPGRFDDSISLITKLFSSPDALHAAFWPQPGSSSSRAPSPPPCQALAQAQAQAQGGVSAGRPSSSLHGPARSDTGTAAGAHASTHKPTRAPGPSAGSLQLDWAALQELYAAVLDPAPGSAAGSRQLASGLSAALQALLGALSSHSPSSQALANPGLLRQVAVLLACPLLEQPEYGSLVSAAATCLTSSLDSKAQGWLVDMWSNGEAYATGQLRRLVMALQQFVNISVRRSSAAGLRGAAAAQGWTGPGPWGSLGVEGAVRLLSLLHRANARRGPMALSLHEFYNPSVNDDALFSIKEDFKRWKAPHRYPFSFCAYPFLYDPASKARVLTYENKTRQYEELNASLFRGLFASVTAAQIGGGAAGGPDGPGGPHGGGSGPELCPFLVLKVRRGPSLLGDTLVQIGRAKEQGCLAKPLKVKFVGEEGVDEGGVQKEFFSLLLRQLMSPDYGMFTYDQRTQLHWFRPSTLLDLGTEFELAGTLVGLAIYNSHILELGFPRVLYAKLTAAASGMNGGPAGRPPEFGLPDLAELAPETAAGLARLLDMPAEQVEGLGLCFQAEVDAGFGERLSVELMPGGAEVAVTAANRAQYVRLYVIHLLDSSIARQFEPFACGFAQLCAGPTLGWFRPEELELLVCGSRQLDMRALQAVALYDDGYSAGHTVIAWFWQVVHSWDAERHKRLLAFVTGSDRVPINGLAALTPPLVISRNGPHSERLPTAHTCFNHMLLPEYNSLEVLASRLELAIENAEGFGLI